MAVQHWAEGYSPFRIVVAAGAELYLRERAA